ncbi:MAG: alpha/beta hydrolase [Erysipelotrichaceae bacterium]|nr:alpha/beta hydrolase [Erysipelotrichaceae bacterium]
MNKKKVVIAATSGVALSLLGVSYYFFNNAIKRPKSKVKTSTKETVIDPITKRRNEFNEAHLGWYQTVEKETLEMISFDGLILKAKYIKAKEPTNKTLIAIHGYHSNGEREYMTYVKFYYDLGYNILLPDDRAHGESEGKYIGFGWLDRIDCIGWINYILSFKNASTQIVLHGISMGAATVLMASGEHLPSQVKAIIADCGYTSAWDEFAHQLKYYKKLPVFPILHVSNLISKLIAKYDFKEASALKQVEKSVTPTLFIHGKKDEFVPTRMVNELYEACQADKELLLIDEAGHALSHVYEEELYHQKVKNFLDRYVR